MENYIFTTNPIMMSAHIDKALGRTVRTGVHIGNVLLLLVQHLFMCHVVPLFDGNYHFTMSFIKGNRAHDPFL